MAGENVYRLLYGDVSVMTFCILHALSILQEAPMLLPVPPVAGCAPCWNIYRLHEALSAVGDVPFEVEVVSACTFDQVAALTAYPHSANYRWMPFSERKRLLSHSIAQRIPLSQAVFRRMFGANTWLTTFYNRQLYQHWRGGQFDLFLLDEAPQNLNYLSRVIPRERLAFFFRAEIGMSRRYLSRVGLILVTNDALADYVRDVLPHGEPVPTIAVVPNSLGAEFSHIRPRETSAVRRNVIFCGRFVPEKGVRELVEAFRLVHQRCPDARLRIVGGSSYGVSGATITDYEREVKALAQMLPDGVISFAGYVPYERIPTELLAADVAVFPSVYVEGFGMAALEAMRCGLPVVVSNRAGFSSFVRHGENGLIVDDPADANALSNAIIELLQNDDLARRIALAGSATAERFTPEASARAFVEAIQAYRDTIYSRS